MPCVTSPVKPSPGELASSGTFAFPPEDLARIHPPTLILASTLDHLLPSLNEAQDLIRILPNAKIHHLPHSGHACLLERDTNLLNILKQEDFLSKQLTTNHLI